MPFTLAHPAAVLPLRRYCPRLLSFPALILGSLSPDAGYCFARWQLDEFSHQWLGSVCFCLPVGLLLLGLLYWVGSPIAARLPDPGRRIFLPLCRQPLGSPLAVVVSLLIGIWTHLLWDSFTHPNGWLVEHSPLLQSPIVSFRDQTLRLHHLVWYVFSFAGVAWVCLAYQRWQPAAGDATAKSSRAKWRDAIVIAALIVPVEVIHHMANGAAGIFLVAALSLAIVVWGAWKIGTKPRREGRGDT